MSGAFSDHFPLVRQVGLRTPDDLSHDFCQRVLDEGEVVYAGW